MAQIQIRVNPEVMKNEAYGIQESVSNIQREYNALAALVKATTGYWEGEAATAYRKYLDKIDGSMQSLLKRLKEHPEDLLKMAGLYDDAESKAAEAAAALPDNVIF